MVSAVVETTIRSRMKYFTLAIYHSGDECDNDAPLFEAFRQYTQHLSAMKGVLPDDIRALAHLPGVDDGLIVRVEVDHAAQELKLTIRCGDLIMGYYDLVLIYEGFSISAEHNGILAWAARSTGNNRPNVPDLAFHEIDRISDGRIDHRILFHPGAWFAITCANLRWQKIERPDRKLPRFRDRYPGGPPALNPLPATTPTPLD